MRFPDGRVRVPVLPRAARYAGAVAVVLVIFYFSVIAPPDVGDPVLPETVLGFFLDKWLHFAAYAALAAALGYASLAPGYRLDRRELALVFLVALGYGASIELLQAMLPERAFSVADMVANGTGAALGTGPWRLLRG
jgi:VanZ family protein